MKDSTGKSFPTRLGGVITLEEKVKTGKRSKYVCTCSLCSSDEELWPYGSIIGDITAIKKGSTSCGCGKQVSWTKEQQDIRGSRRAKTLGLIYLGFHTEGSYRGDSFIRLYNPKYDYCWCSTTLNSFLNSKGNSCPETRRIGNRLSVKEKTKRLMDTGYFKEGTVFTMDDNQNVGSSTDRSTQVKVYCPLCSEDDYVKAGVCSGVFKSNLFRLGKGSHPCRCSKQCSYTEDQWEYGVNKKITAFGGKDIALIGDKPWCNRARVSWKCKKGHYNEDRVGIIMNKLTCGTCGTCSNVKFGRYKDKAQEVDHLYIHLLKKEGLADMIKIGRTFNLKQRLADYTSTFDTVETLSVVSDTHDNVLEKERLIKDTMNRYHRVHPLKTFGGWRWECFTTDILKESLIKETFKLF